MKRLSKPAFLFKAVLLFVIMSTGVAIAQPPAQGGNPPPAPTNSVTSTSPFGVTGMPEIPGGGVLDGVYIPEHLPNRKPLPYVHEREADIMWAKRVWRVIDLREKINHPLYYPTEPLAKRPSLFNVIQGGIVSGKITTVFAFDPFTMEFGIPLSLPEIAKAMTEVIDVKDSVGNPLFDSLGNAVQKPDTFKADDIKQYMLKEDWFFERQRSVMDVRIIGIAPVIEVDDPVNGKFGYKPIFWIYYPAMRNYLSQFYCYNPYNDAEWRTFDEVFHKRMFSSYSYMESNVYNRTISSYLPGQGMEQMLESERIKDDIFKFEHDMWNF
jgi:gliding motility associated protien GldN